MSYMSYDSNLVIGSACIAVIICYVAISLEQLIFTQHSPRQQKIILCLSGMVFGFAIWAMHFIGMLACDLPQGYSFDLTFTVISYIIAALASTFCDLADNSRNFAYCTADFGWIVDGVGNFWDALYRHAGFKYSKSTS